MSFILNPSSTGIGSTISGGTAGSVLFINPTNTLAQDNAHFFYDDTNNSLILGGTSTLGTITIYPNTTATIGLFVKGLTSQTASLASFFDSSGLNGVTIDKSGFIISQPFSVGIAGTAGAPAFQISGFACGLYTSGSNILGISTSGTEAIKIDATQNTTFTGYTAHPSGSASNPSIAFSDNLDTGIYEPTTGSSGTIGITVNGTQALSMDSAIQWGWNNTAGVSNTYHKATVTDTTKVRFFDIDMTRNGTGGVNITVNKFTCRSTSDIGMLVNVATVDVQRNNPSTARTQVGFRATGGINTSNTIASGGLTQYGFDFAPSAANAGSVTGGTITLTAFRVGTSISSLNYSGGGATTYFRGYFLGDNWGGAYGNTEATPDLLIQSDGTNGLIYSPSVGSVQILRSNGTTKTIECNDTGAGFFGATPVGRSSAYTPTNVTTDRSYDANSTSIDELADVLGSLIADLQATGIIG